MSRYIEHRYSAAKCGSEQFANDGVGFSFIDFIGGDEEDRTPDLRIANATLSQLSYVPTVWTRRGF
jgi:hypothetical protein